MKPSEVLGITACMRPIRTVSPDMKSVTIHVTVLVWLVASVGTGLVLAQNTGSQTSDQNQAAPTSEQPEPD
jgi:hypothetical protein